MPAAIQDRTEHLLKRPPRPHPYARVHHDVRGQYYDFKARPELVGTALEDFVPHRDCAGTDEFFALLRHINRPDGPFETTDRDRKSVGEGKSVSVGVEMGGRRIIKKNKYT